MTKRSAALLCAALVCVPGAVYANNPPDAARGVVLHMTADGMAETEAKTPPAAEVRPGETVTITGACLVPEISSDNLRVVLTIADGSAGSAPGYRSVLATDSVIRDGGLEVRVPDLPQAANHVFDVRVFRLGQPIPRVCDAGSIRIGAAAQRKVG
jgi:hypothetical protein